MCPKPVDYLRRPTTMKHQTMRQRQQDGGGGGTTTTNSNGTTNRSPQSGGGMATARRPTSYTMGKHKRRGGVRRHGIYDSNQGFTMALFGVACVLVTLLLVILYVLLTIAVNLSVRGDSSLTSSILEVHHAPGSSNLPSSSLLDVHGVVAGSSSSRRTKKKNTKKGLRGGGTTAVNAKDSFVTSKQRGKDDIMTRTTEYSASTASSNKQQDDGSLSNSRSSTRPLVDAFGNNKPPPKTDDTPPQKFDSIKDLSWEDMDFQQSSLSASTSCATNLTSDEISFTLATQVSEDRLWMLTQHCSRWTGPISVAVLTDRPVQSLWEQIQREGRTYNATCRPDQLHIRTLSKDTTESKGYPVNTLRNLAMGGVQTSHVFYADVDFWESGNLYTVLHSDFIRQELSHDSYLALVIPAFQIGRQCKEYIDCQSENLKAMPYTKSDVIALVKQRQASVFDPTNRGAHGSTSYSKWSRMNDGDLYDVPCMNSNRYEPYYATRYCKELPPYQEAFTGYGKNKVTQIMQMRRVGYDFSQLGGVFIVHYPHLESRDREVWNQGKVLWDKVKLKQWKEKQEEIVAVDGSAKTTVVVDEEEEQEEEAVVDDENEADDEEEALQEDDTDEQSVEETDKEAITTNSSIDWTQYKRGQVDKIFVEFKTWLQEEVKGNERVPMCTDAIDDDEKLWV